MVGKNVAPTPAVSTNRPRGQFPLERSIALTYILVSYRVISFGLAGLGVLLARKNSLQWGSYTGKTVGFRKFSSGVLQFSVKMGA